MKLTGVYRDFPSLFTGDWHTIYMARDNKKIVEGGPLRGYYRQIKIYQRLWTHLLCILCQGSTIWPNCKQADCELLAWGVVSNVRWNMCVTAVMLSMWTLFSDGCPQAMGNGWWGWSVLSVAFSGLTGHARYSQKWQRDKKEIRMSQNASVRAFLMYSQNLGMCSDG